MKRMTLATFKAVAQREGIEFDGFCERLERFKLGNPADESEVGLLQRFFTIVDRLDFRDARVVSRVIDLSGQAMYRDAWAEGVVAAGGDLKKVSANERRRTKRAIARIERERLERSKAKK